jgi:hypothetical protein
MSYMLTHGSPPCQDWWLLVAIGGEITVNAWLLVVGFLAIKGYWWRYQRRFVATSGFQNGLEFQVW